MVLKRGLFKFFICFLILTGIILSMSSMVSAAPEDGDVALPSVDINIGTADSPQETAASVQVILIIAIITLAPSLIILLTSFTRIIIALHFLRSALGTQQMPPNQVLIGLALFLTLFIMSPTFTRINEEAFQPYSNGEMSQQEFFKEAMEPLRDFMFSQVEEKDLILFTNLSGISGYEYRDDIPNSVLIPSFIVGELTKGFKIGFVLYIPFIVIDMVVASTLMAMGMMMLPPALISAPFKILLFILVDGWTLVISNIVQTFMGGG